MMHASKPKGEEAEPKEAKEHEMSKEVEGLEASKPPKKCVKGRQGR